MGQRDRPRCRRFAGLRWQFLISEFQKCVRTDEVYELFLHDGASS
jgi:hypothetical protein